MPPPPSQTHPPRLLEPLSPTASTRPLDLHPSVALSEVYADNVFLTSTAGGIDLSTIATDTREGFGITPMRSFTGTAAHSVTPLVNAAVGVTCCDNLSTEVGNGTDTSPNVGSGQASVTWTPRSG